MERIWIKIVVGIAMRIEKKIKKRIGNEIEYKMWAKILVNQSTLSLQGYSG